MCGGGSTYVAPTAEELAAAAAAREAARVAAEESAAAEARAASVQDAAPQEGTPTGLNQSQVHLPGDEMYSGLGQQRISTVSGHASGTDTASMTSALLGGAVGGALGLALVGTFVMRARCKSRRSKPNLPQCSA